MRSQSERLNDILRAIEVIQDNLARYGLDNGTAYDAIRMRLVEIGEATKALDNALLAHEPGIEWAAIKRMRDHAVHRYFDTQYAIVQHIVTEEITPLDQAVRRLRERL